MNCQECYWKHPDTCRSCRVEQESRILFKGKAQDMTPQEIAKAWNYGRRVEQLEEIDFGRN